MTFPRFDNKKPSSRMGPPAPPPQLLIGNQSQYLHSLTYASQISGNSHAHHCPKFLEGLPPLLFLRILCPLVPPACEWSGLFLWAEGPHRTVGDTWVLRERNQTKQVESKYRGTAGFAGVRLDKVRGERCGGGTRDRWTSVYPHECYKGHSMHAPGDT